jgi:hypothetical protein
VKYEYTKLMIVKKILIMLAISCIFAFSAMGGPYPNRFSPLADNTTEEISRPRASVANYLMSPVAYQWKSHSSGVRYDFGDDQAGSFPLPFTFSFYGQNYNTVYFSSNGYLSFYSTSPTVWSNPTFPSDSSNARRVIAPFWDDLTGTNSGGIFTNAGADYVCISWIDYYRLSEPIIGTFQVVLFQDGRIQFNYQYISYVSGGYTTGLNYGDGYYYNSYTQITDSTNYLGLLFTPGVESDTVLTTPADQEFEANSGPHLITWTATDSTLGASPTYAISSNGVSIVSNMPWSSGSPINLDVSGWSHGEYDIVIFVYDGLGGEVHDEVNLLITPAGGNLAPSFSFRPENIDFATDSYSSYTIEWGLYDPNVSGNQYYNIYYQYSWGGQYSLTGSQYWESGGTASYTFYNWNPDHFRLNFVVNDGFGLTASDTVEVVVFDPYNENPTLTTPEDITYVVDDTNAPHITWTINDEYYTTNRLYEVFRDGTRIAFNLWGDGTSVDINPASLSIGTYTFEIVVDDAQLGIATDTVVVNVVPNVAPVINELPDLQYSVYSTTPAVLMWSIADTTFFGQGDYTIRVDGSIVTTGNWNGSTPVSFPWDDITPGVYTVLLEVDDNAGGTDTDTVIVTVNNCPYLSSPANIQYVVGSSDSYAIVWNVIDLTIGDSTYSITKDGVEIANGNWISGDNIGDIDVSGLDIGTYEFKIIVFDGTGLNSTDIVIVTVVAPPEEEADSGPLAWYWIVLIVAGAGVAVFAMVKIVKKNKYGNI